MADNKDEDPKKENKGAEPPLPQKRVVVTYGMKPKEHTDEDVPEEILPHAPTVVLKSPVEIGPAPVAGNVSRTTTTLKGHLHPESEDAPPPHYAPPPRASSPPPVPPPSYIPPVGAGSSQAEPVAANTSSSSSSFALFLSMLTSVAVVALMFFAYYSQKELADLHDQSEHDKHAVHNLLASAQQSVGQFEAIREANTKEREGLKVLQQELEHSQSRFVMQRGNRDWVLSEVNYLVFMANERLQAAKDIATAATQLKVADDRLSTLGDPSLLAVKTAITKDIAKLLNTIQVDKQALWAQVGALSDLIEKLDFKVLGENQETQEKTPFTLSSWQNALHQSWQEFKSLIKITRIEDNPIPVSFTQQEQAQILRTLQLLKEQTQWAVLQGDSKIYLETLSTLDKYVKTYFVEDIDQTTLLARVQQLQQQRVDITLPDISDSLQALSQAMLSKKE